MNFIPWYFVKPKWCVAYKSLGLKSYDCKVEIKFIFDFYNLLRICIYDCFLKIKQCDKI